MAPRRKKSPSAPIDPVRPVPDEPTKPKRGRPSGGSKKAARGKANQARQSSGSSSGGYSGGSSNEGSTSDDNQAAGNDAASEAGEPRGAGEARRAPEPPPVSTVALRAELFLHDARGRLSETPAHHITLNSLDRISRQLTWRQVRRCTPNRSTTTRLEPRHTHRPLSHPTHAEHDAAPARRAGHAEGPG